MTLAHKKRFWPDFQKISQKANSNGTRPSLSVSALKVYGAAVSGKTDGLGKFQGANLEDGASRP